MDLLLISAAETAADDGGFLGVVKTVNDAVSGVVWGWPALILLLFVGVLMSVLTKFFQISHIGRWFRCTIGAVFKDRKVTAHTKDKQISQFQSVCAALASTVGTGNIAGVASAIVTGGPGAVFWMWIMAFFGMMTNFAENVLGILYRVKNREGEWSGGAMYYLKYGLGAKKHCRVLGSVLAVLFCVFCLFASFGIGDIVRVVHLRDGLFHAENLLCGLAADEVALVLSGHGADHIGTFSAGFTQDVLGRSVAGANGNIELVRDHTAQFPVLLDYGGLVTLRTQGLRKVESHLAAADYDYFHDFSSKFTRPAERSRHSRRAGPGAAAYLVDTSADIVAAYLKPPCYGARGLTVVSHIAQAVVGHPLCRADLRRLEHQPVKRNVLMDDVEIP